MEDVLTEIPPPSRFFPEDLNNFASPPPSLPTPFLVLPDAKPDQSLFPDLLVVAISNPSLHIFHHVLQRTLIGGLVLPETPFSGNSVEPSLGDKSCNIYALDGDGSSTLLVSFQCPVSAERSNVVAKLLIGGQIAPKHVLILDSIQSQNFRGKLSPDETYAFKLETSAERKESQDLSGAPLLSGVEYFPSGSVVDGLAAGLLTRCQMKNIKGTLCVTWPEYGGSVVSLIRSILQKSAPNCLVVMLPQLDAEKDASKLNRVKECPFDSELYT